MATHLAPEVPIDLGTVDAAPQRSHWRMHGRLSSMAERAENFLGRSALDRGPWLAVAFACGIITWFWLGGPAQWIAALMGCVIMGLGALALWRGEDRRVHLRTAVLALAFMLAAGLSIIWSRSELVGTPALERPVFSQFDGRVLERIDQPAQERLRLVLATRDPDNGQPIKIRVNVPQEQDQPGLAEGVVVRLRARLMPPASPMLPGAYDFARTAWFEGYAATGSMQGDLQMLAPASGQGGFIASLQRMLSAHVRSQLGGSPGTIAAAFASGDRGAIAQEDQDAMRDAGLTHLLSISGLHVSAVIAAAYVLAIRLLSLWPWLTLRVRLPVVAAGIGALAGVGYTLLTGAEVPTVRSCVGALLVLIALALGREPLSLRMVAVASIVVMLLWPETLVGPSFQMSFSAVIAIVALHSSTPVRNFVRTRDEAWWKRFGRSALMLLITGLVIEIALMPVVLFHFHRAGVYGAFANVIAIPLVTFISMPFIAIALFFDLLGLGAPFWWVAGKSLDLLLWIAHFTAGQPGVVKLMPQMGPITFAFFVAGGFWLALWRGRARLWGFAPTGVATLMLLTTPIPDLLVSGDGRHVGITGEDDRLLVLRNTKSSYTRDNLMELAGVQTDPLPLDEWPDARCNKDFCAISISRGGRDWHVLMSRSSNYVDLDQLRLACSQADIVVSDRGLPRLCEPRWIKADRRMLSDTGGLAINLSNQTIAAVADTQGDHGWWRAGRRSNR